MSTAPGLPPALPAERHVELLSWLDPDLLHPARLAGPHAWHPWGLTRHAPTDNHIRLVVAPTRNADEQIERITDNLADQLTGPTWPPSPRLDVDQHPGQLTCHHLGEPIAHITIHTATWDRGGFPARGTDHYTRTGWPILDEHAALADRIHAIDPTRPDPEDLDDLANWIKTTLDRPTPRQRTAGLQHLVDKCRTLARQDLDRLTSVLNPTRTTDQPDPAIAYLADSLAPSRARAGAVPTRASVTR